ncbi:flagellar hook-associated protein FlgL [Nocardioides sp.]|uniref:flagellar hook-associated protein FlgL n=1 Tax=Nocardioides sp. TaxID=35761 RepID=UPI003516900C
MTTVRVTQNMITNRSLSAMQAAQARLAVSQEQLSTGRVVNRPSDSPTAASVAMRFRSAASQQESYVRNADNAMSWLGTIDTTLSGMSAGVRRARELGLQGASTGTTSPAARAALAAEVDQLKESLVSQANATFLGRPVLGGLTPGATAFDATGAYVGVPGQVSRTVADGVKVRVDVTGTDVVGPNGSSLFDDLETLSTALAAGDDTTIRSTLASLETRLTTINTVQADVGARYNRVEAASQTAKDSIITLQTRLSEVEEADLPATAVKLQMQEVAYQAALAATSRVMQPSLLQFLR